MLKKKVLVVYGTRPEFIKLIPLIRELESRKNVSLSVCSTGQHRELVRGIEKQFGFHRAHALNVMKKNQTPSDVMARLSIKFPKLLHRIKPDWVVVQGDTISAFMVALLAFMQKVKVAHVEAGLRSFDKANPFPEEVSRTMITQLADLHFAPTKLAARRLLDEGVAKKKVLVTGNTIVDAMRSSSRQGEYDKARRVIKLAMGEEFVLVTMHRRESFGKPLVEVCQAISEFAKHGSSMHVIWPVHKNPNVEPVVRRLLGKHNNVHLVDPLDYVEFQQVLKACRFVMSDSGGVQEEAPYLGKALLVLRDTTERPECVTCGSAILVGTNRKNVRDYMEKLSSNTPLFRKMSRVRQPFGRGNVSKRIANALLLSN